MGHGRGHRDEAVHAAEADCDLEQLRHLVADDGRGQRGVNTDDIVS